MPINNIQYRAEIGIFYNALHPFYAQKMLPFFQVAQSLLENVFRNSSVLGNLHSWSLGEISPSPCHLLSFIFLLLFSPFILLFVITFSVSYNMSKTISIFTMSIFVSILFLNCFGLPSPVALH